jgi:hypothetical protein
LIYVGRGFFLGEEEKERKEGDLIMKKEELSFFICKLS